MTTDLFTFTAFHVRFG